MTPEEILKARYNAAEIAEKMIAAYWAPDSRDFLITAAHEKFAKLADAMGYVILQKLPAPQVEPEQVAA